MFCSTVLANSRFASCTFLDGRDAHQIAVGSGDGDFAEERRQLERSPCAERYVPPEGLFDPRSRRRRAAPWRARKRRGPGRGAITLREPQRGTRSAGLLRRRRRGKEDEAADGARRSKEGGHCSIPETMRAASS